MIEGVIDRRILVNFRVDATCIQQLLPDPFRPQLVSGHAIAGICLIRLTEVRPLGWPSLITAGSENAAHRIAVEWDEAGLTHAGVYVPRRDTNSRLNTLVGGRVFPGVHHRARFTTWETGRELDVSMESHDGNGSITVQATVAEKLPADSVFADLEDASAFFEQGALGVSPNRERGLDALRLEIDQWNVTPLDVHRVESSFFGDPEQFPAGSVEFDDALLMRRIPHRWITEPGMTST